MFLSIFEIFKIGIGPSSSHTVGPMVAAGRFLHQISQHAQFKDMVRLRASLHGSLAFTGKGPASDVAVMLGLLGENPDSIDPNAGNGLIDELQQRQTLSVAQHILQFSPDNDIIFDYDEAMALHPNGMRFYALEANGDVIFQEDYYSVGGGFVQTAKEMGDSQNFAPVNPLLQAVPYPFSSAKEMLEMGEKSGLSIAQMKRENELTHYQETELDGKIDRIIDVMEDCIERGLTQDGILPGGLKVKRRAKEIFEKVKEREQANLQYPHDIMDIISLYALAVNEENAAGGRVVTAPTNGAAGIIPAVLTYYRRFCPKDMAWDRPQSRIFMLTAAAIGGIIKHNASISGAEVGCQGEVGSASAMAAAGLAAALGGSNQQIENAAEIALEHHLGMTCDPIGGLVQIPCIERNAMGAIKSVNAASLALKGDGTHFVPLDAAIKTMKETGDDMMTKYKETSQGGLAVNGVAC